MRHGAIRGGLGVAGRWKSFGAEVTGGGFLVARAFDKVVGADSFAIGAEELADAWHRYVVFAIYVEA